MPPRTVFLLEPQTVQMPSFFITLYIAWQSSQSLARDRNDLQLRSIESGPVFDQDRKVPAEKYRQIDA